MEKNKTIKYIVIALIGLIVFYFILKPNLPKKLYNRLLNGNTEKAEILQKKIQEIQEKKYKDSLTLVLIIQDLKDQKKITSDSLKIANQKIKNYEKTLSNYNNSNYNDRFLKFSKLISEKD